MFYGGAGMNRNVGTIALCMALGAAVMYGSTNFRIHIEPVAAPEAKAPPAAAPGAEPGRLPAALVDKATAELPRFDPQVRPAQGVRQAAPDNVKVVQINDGALRWDSDSLPNGPLPVYNGKVILTLDRNYPAEKLFFNTTNDAAAAKSVTKDGTPNIIQTGPDNPTVVTVDVDKLGDTQSDVLTLYLWADEVGVRSAQPAVVTLRRRSSPFPTPSGPALAIQTFTNTQFRPLVPKATLPQPIPVFRTDTDEPYFRVAGAKDAAAQLRFVLQPEKGSARPVEMKLGSNSAGIGWDVLLALPPQAFDTSATLYVWQTDGSRIQTTPDSLALTFKRLPAKLGPPTLGVPAAVGAANGQPSVTLAPAPVSTPDLPTYYTNGKSFTIAATKPAAGAEILTYAVGDEPEKMLPGSDAGASQTITANALGDGDLVVRAFARSGTLASDAAKVRLIVRTQPPRIEEVKAGPGFGQHNNGIDTVVIQFSPTDLIDAKTLNPAQDIFQLVHNEDPADVTANGAKVKVGLATLDPATNRVTLNVTGVVPGTYTLVVPTAKGGKLQDVYGNKLVQGPVVRSVNLIEMPVAGISAGAAAGGDLPSQRAGVTLETGPPVYYPEYTKFRTSPDGFNPSDRVESRVVRLYYYRDAHRVAQLINRTVKSYNAATVDVRRRAADSVRDKADEAADERKRLEGLAVRAAQEARAAEADLASLQSGITTARSQGATARIDLLQRQQELEQARRELDRLAAVAPAPSTESAIANQRLNVREAESALQTTRNVLLRGGLTEPERNNFTALAIAQERALIDERSKLSALEAQSQTRTNGDLDAARLRVRALEVEIQKLQGVSATADLVERGNADRIAAAQSTVAGKRELEARAVESWQVKELQERRLREGQFRREVAAAREDPDTYAPGAPESFDPVMQVSVSVIGEGLIQLRGPIKGLNVIRTMVNQIDAPVGQVRVLVHTLQVNGERADRMEKVIANIQRYLDHSRFLTAQSSQMLRNAVTAVASRKAAEAAATLAPNCTQADRDQRYLYAFFGKDFTDELTILDSEFLKTGNKLLSLHSMDSTSLSAGLFLLALAKNDVRAEIIAEFQGLVQGQLPQAEIEYYLAGLSQPKCCDACKDKKEYLLAYNSKFQSFVGFFNAQVTGTDTLNPLQREFIKLAQIFKARMVTEMQLRQRVMERALLEERVGTEYLKELKKAKDLEDEAKEALRKIQDQLQPALSTSNQSLVRVVVLLQQLEDEQSTLVNSLRFIDENKLPVTVERNQIASAYSTQFQTKTGVVTLPVLREGGDLDLSHYQDLWKILLSAEASFDQFVYTEQGHRDELAEFKKLLDELREVDRAGGTMLLSPREQARLRVILPRLLDHVSDEIQVARQQVEGISKALQNPPPDPSRAVALYNAFRRSALAKLRAGSQIQKDAVALTEETNRTFATLGPLDAGYQAALKRAQQARRPLDEKKLLDMLVDDMEDKFVEILEGTRAHTSNIDNYMKSVTTALDDDFNTQYYLPSFARARGASRAWDVTLSQIETTSVLTNNRMLGKVSPAATFEFDLPKRDILITEGFRSAKALVDEYGALVNDPSFLALAKIYSGNPVSMMQQGGGGLAAVRNVLPGLPTSADEKILAQAGPGRQEFGTALDGLIPDPAIYKFETGTGYEIRPVLSPDGQAVVFGFDYMYTTDVREPVRADEKHLGRVKRHFISTDVQLSNFELREVSKYQVAIKVARTAKGVQLLQDIPGVGVLFRPLPSAAASLQQNLIYSQATIFPTLFDLMGLRYAPAVADLDPLAERMAEFAARYRRTDLEQRIYDIGASRVDGAIRTPYGEQRHDLYRSQMSIPYRHPNGYTGPGLRLQDGSLREGYDPNVAFPDTQFAPGTSPEGRPKPYNPNPQPGAPGFDTPYTIPQLQLPPGVPPYTGSYNNLIRPNAPGTPGAPLPTIGAIPGLPPGPVNYGKPVPYTPALPTTAGPPRLPTELPGTRLPPVVTPGAPTVYKPPALTPLPPTGR